MTLDWQNRIQKESEVVVLSKFRAFSLIDAVKKSQATNWENIFAKHTPDKGLVSK